MEKNPSGSGSGKNTLGTVILVLLAGAIAGSGGVAAQNKPAAPTVSAGNGKLYIGTYTGDIRIYDEAM